MAQAKDSKSKTTRKDRWGELRSLWKQDPKKWIEFLETHNAKGAILAGERIKLHCPYHDDRNPSAEIHLTKGHFRCYSGGCNHWEWDPIRFLALGKKFNFPTYLDALKEFKAHFGARIAKTVFKEYEKDYAFRKQMRWIAACAQRKLDDAWQNAHNTASAQQSVDWLKGRGIQDSSYHGSLGLWPRMSDITAFVRNSGGTDEDLNEIKALYGNYFDIKYQDWVTFIYASDPSTPTAFKIRKPLTTQQEVAQGGKQVVFIGEKNGVKGFFGMLNPGYSALVGDPQYHEAYVTEGEMDALMVYENQVTSSQCDAIFLGAGGSGHNGMDSLTTAGITQANIIADDDQGGDGFIDSVMDRTHECSLRIFVWPTALKHPGGAKMDPDSAIAQFGFVPVMNEFFTKTNFVYPHTWAYDAASEELIKTHPDDVRSQTDIAKKYAKKLHHSAERHEFLNLVNHSYNGVSPIEVRKAISDEEDNHLSLVRDIVQKVLARYHLHYWDPATRKLSLWDKKHHLGFEIDPTRKDSIGFIVTEMCQGSIYEWVRDEVGLPGWIPAIEGKDAAPTKGYDVVQRFRWFLEEALLQLPPKSPKKPTDLKGQGVHLDQVTETSQGYLVSGNRMYDLHWNTEGTCIQKVEPLKGPSCRNDVFLVSEQQIRTIGDWADPIFTSDADILRTPEWDSKETLDHVFRIINSYWRFRHQKADATMIALYPFYSYIIDAFTRRVQVHLLGEAESGKSSLLALIAGGQQLSEFQLTQCARAEMDTSVSGLVQHYPGARIVVGLDEVNDANDGTRNSQQVKELYSSLRGLAVQGRTSRLRGSTQFRSNSSEIAIATVTASGTRIFDAMDASRFKTVHLVKDPALGSIAARMQKDYPDDFWPKLRHAIAYHALHNAKAIAIRSKRIEMDYADADSLPIASSRFREGLYPLVSIADELGWNGYDFLYEFCKAREDEERKTNNQTPGQDVFEAVLNIPTFPLDGERDHREVTIGEMLINPSWRDNISSVPGVYLDVPSQLLAISWSHMEGHLRRLGGIYSATNMQTMADSCRLYVDPSVAQSQGALQRFKQLGLLASRFSIFNVKEYLKMGTAKLGLPDKPAPSMITDVTDISDEEAGSF